MDVNDVSKVVSISPSATTAPGKSRGPGSFREIYQGQLEAVAQPDAVSRQDARTDLLERGDRILDLLDTYAAELGNPQKSLKEIDPLARVIEQEVGLFGEKRSSYPEIDAEMQGLTEALEITASVALMKFRRGDFL